MKKTFVWETIQSLSKQEKSEVKRFLQSPLFNQRKDVIDLYKYLIAYSKKENGAPERVALFQLVYPTQAFDDQQMRLLLSYLYKLLEQYLVWSSFKNAAFENKHLLLSTYRERKLDRHFQKTLKKANTHFEQQPLRHPEFHFSNFQLAHEQYLFLLGSGRTRDLNLEQVENQLDATFISMKLRQACFSLAHQAVFNKTYRIALIDEILKLATEPAYQDIPAIRVYYYCYKALFEADREENFQIFKEKLFEHTSQFPHSEMQDLYLLAINFCIRKINESNQRYLEEALDLYKKGLEEAVLLQNGRISRFAYNNIVGIGLRLSEWNWVSKFVQDYKDSLDPSYREATFSLNSARLEFERKNYQGALLFLQKADYKDLINNMVAKTLQLKIYYELEEFELLYSHLKTMKVFIRRNKKMSYHHQNWSNIVRFTQKLVELNPYDKNEKQELRTALESEEILTEREWLLKQLDIG